MPKPARLLHLILDFNKVILFPTKSFPIELIVSYTSEAATSSRGGSNSLFSKFNFADYFKFNDELIEELAKLRQKSGLKIHIFTNSTFSIESAESKAHLAKFADQVFLARELDLHKDQPASYMFLAEKLGAEPEQLLFADDTVTNVEAAAAAGLHTHHYLDNQGLLAAINNFLKLESGQASKS